MRVAQGAEQREGASLDAAPVAGASGRVIDREPQEGHGSDVGADALFVCGLENLHGGWSS